MPNQTHPTATVTRTPPTQVKTQQDPSTVASVGVDVSRCPAKNDKGTRQCILAADHRTYAIGDAKGNAFTETIDGHLFRSGGKRKEYAPVTGTLLFEDVPDSEEVHGVREQERSDEQKEIDRRVELAYKEWVAAGKPKEFNKSPRKRIMFEPGNEATVAHMLDSAARYAGYNVRVVGPKTHDSGAKFFYYVVKDRTTREKTGATPESDKES
jgi:hypothetical protein